MEEWRPGGRWRLKKTVTRTYRRVGGRKQAKIDERNERHVVETCKGREKWRPVELWRLLKNHKNTPRVNGRKQEKVDERNERPVVGEESEGDVQGRREMKARKGNHKGTERRGENKRKCRNGTRTMRMVEGNEVRRRQGGGTGRWLKALLACESPRFWVRVTCPTWPHLILPLLLLACLTTLEPSPSPLFSPPTTSLQSLSLPPSPYTHLHTSPPIFSIN